MGEDRVARRLAAILAADVVGYSRLMGADEEGTLAVLNAHRREFLEPKITEYRGRIVKRTGDGVLIEFASVVDAVRCAIEMQRGMRERNEPVPPKKRMDLRIGIHVGDIIIEDGDVFGDGVNIAARLEGFAAPGGVCISDDAYRQVRDKIDVNFQDSGEQELKNIARPVRVYQFGPDKPLVGAETLARGLTLPDKPSIAVLPFQNMSGDPEQEYFADGMVEDITTGLSRFKWLFVIARNSSFTYKGKAVDVRQVGRELGVRYVLEGSVRKAAGRVRITTQLIEAESRKHIWAERYDRAIDDVFALQDDITVSTVAAIEPSLRRAEIERAKRKRPENLDAYDLVLRATPFVDTLMPGEALQALPLLERALALEPNYALAHGYTALCHEILYVRAGRREENRTRACPQLEDSHGGIRMIHRRSADSELTDAPLWPARRPMGSDQGAVARPGGPCRSDGQGQPAVRGGGALSLPRRHSLAGPSRAVRGVEAGPHPPYQLGQERRVGEGVQGLGGRRRQRIRHDRLHHRAGSPAQRRRAQKKDGGD